MAAIPGRQMAGPMARRGMFPRVSPFIPETVNMKPKTRKTLTRATTSPVLGLMSSGRIFHSIRLRASCWPGTSFSFTVFPQRNCSGLKKKKNPSQFPTHQLWLSYSCLLILSDILGLCPSFPASPPVSAALCLSVCLFTILTSASHTNVHRRGSLRFPPVSCGQGKTPVWVSLDTSTAAVPSTLSLGSGRKAWLFLLTLRPGGGTGEPVSHLSLPTVRVAVPGSGSSAVALCAVAERRGRKDLVRERGKAACEPALLATSLSEQAQTRRRTRGGARRADPRGGHRAEEAAQGPVWVLRAAPKGWAGRLDPLPCPVRVWGARLSLARDRNSGRLAYGAAWAPRWGSVGQRWQLEMSLGNLDPSLATNWSDPTRPIAAPRSFPDCWSLKLEAPGAGRAAHVQAPLPRTALGPGAGGSELRSKVL